MFLSVLQNSYEQELHAVNELKISQGKDATTEPGMRYIIL
jgi:hypothetical protein